MRTDLSWVIQGDWSLGFFFSWGYSFCDLGPGLTGPTQIFHFTEEAIDLLRKRKEGSYDN